MVALIENRPRGRAEERGVGDLEFYARQRLAEPLVHTEAERDVVAGRCVRVRASDAPTTGFRGFTLSLIVSQPSTVSSLIDAAGRPAPRR